MDNSDDYNWYFKVPNIEIKTSNITPYFIALMNLGGLFRYEYESQ